ncbi:MAG TPA: 2'-5' RNA ligase family protein [Gammaproteobacteria bacterium]|nr:2'-5' RNA ligase family protein [Gammaproteobacteria bacterium]
MLKFGSMSQAHHYSLWLMPGGDTETCLAAIIRDLSKTYGTPCFPPHVTLLASIERAPTEVVAITRALASRLKRLQFASSGLVTSGAYFRSLFIRAVVSDELLAAYMLARQAFGSQPAGDFMPHLSLLYSKLPEIEKQKIIADLMDRNMPTRFMLNSVDVYATAGTPQDWRLIESVPLD